MEIISKFYLFLSIEVFQNIFPNKITILSTKKTKPQQLQDRYLPDYPVVYDDYVCEESMFVDSTRPHNSVLDAIGGDYDGLVETICNIKLINIYYIPEI